MDFTDAKCAICLDVWKKPKVTPICSHIFCSHCLETLVDSAKAKGDRSFDFECPLCRRINFLPPGGIQQLQVNAFLDDYATKLRTQLTVQVATQQREIISYDNRHIDVNHQTVRDTKIGNSGELDDADKQYMEGRPNVVFCLDHCKVPPFGTQAPPAKAYCYECNRLVCLDCHDEFHRLHCVTKVEEALKLKSSKCGELLEDVRQLVPSFESALELTHTQVAAFCQQTEAAIDRVAANLEDFISRLNVIKAHFVTNVQRCALGQTMQIHNSLKNWSCLLERAKLLEKQLYDVLVNEDLQEMVIKLRLFEHEAHELHQSIPDELEFESDSQSKSELDFSECFAHMQMFMGAASALLDNFPLMFDSLRTARNNMWHDHQRKYDRQTLLRYRLSPFVQMENHLYDTLRDLGIFKMSSTLPFARSHSQPQSVDSSDDESIVRYSSLPPYLSDDSEHGLVE